MDGEELRERIKTLGWTYVEAAYRLGMSLPGLHHNLRNERPIRRQTELLLGALEIIQNSTEAVPAGEAKPSGRKPQRRSAAKTNVGR